MMPLTSALRILEDLIRTCEPGVRGTTEHLHSTVLHWQLYGAVESVPATLTHVPDVTIAGARAGVLRSPGVGGDSDALSARDISYRLLRL